MVPSTILLKAEMGKAKEKVNCITYSGKKTYFSETCLEKNRQCSHLLEQRKLKKGRLGRGRWGQEAHTRVFRRFPPNLGASSSGQVVVLMVWRKGQGARLPNRTSDVCPVCGKSKDKPRAQRKTRTESV